MPKRTNITGQIFQDIFNNCLRVITHFKHDRRVKVQNIFSGEVKFERDDSYVDYVSVEPLSKEYITEIILSKGLNPENFDLSFQPDIASETYSPKKEKTEKVKKTYISFLFDSSVNGFQLKSGGVYEFRKEDLTFFVVYGYNQLTQTAQEFYISKKWLEINKVRFVLIALA